ncbi:MAG: tetratricopeptide repeat protein, partial [Caulobacteraceae bacterium]
ATLSALAAVRPTGLEPPRRLAALDLSLGDADGAIHALRRANAIAPGRPDLLAPLGELLVLKAGGDVGPEARALFSRTLAGDPGSPTARYYLGRAEIAGGRLGAGRGMWRALLDDLPAGDPRRPLLAREIAVAERTGRLADAAPSGPPVRIFAAIRGMVDGLAARLRLHPDDPAGWARLVRAYGVLGEGESRAAALREARRLYAGRPDVLEALAAAQTPRSDAARP